MNGLSIGQVAKEVEIKPSTIRYYEEIGLLPPAQRSSGQRKYSEEVILKLKFIKLTQNAGFSLEEIQTMVEGVGSNSTISSKWRLLADKKIQDLSKLINKIEIMKGILQKGIQCNCLSWEECLESLSQKEGNKNS
jgi:MerR family redox-sensitive transcriptional activator SoxR